MRFAFKASNEVQELHHSQLEHTVPVYHTAPAISLAKFLAALKEKKLYAFELVIEGSVQC